MTIQARLDARYGRARKRGRRILGWSIVLVLAASVTIAYGWMTVATSASDVDSDVLAFTVVDEHTASVSFQITGHAGREIACAIEALDEEFGVVGWKVVTYPASDEQNRAYQVSVPTLSLATTGLVNDCWLL